MFSVFKIGTALAFAGQVSAMIFAMEGFPMDENGGEGLQDGCGYNLDGACYDLGGFGSNACSVNKESLEKAFN